MNIKAFKMDGLGNDFVIIDQRNYDLYLNKDQIIKICDRNYIGCDQLILIKKNRKVDAGLEFYNSDGSISGACGNGTRCVAEFLSKENKKKEITVWTSSGLLKSNILGDKLVETEIGIPKTNWNEIPLSKNLDTKDLEIEITGKDNNKHVGGTAINVGNPHIIFFVEDCFKYDLKILGTKIENHELFPEKINVTFAQINDKNNISVNVWERGAGLTKACGTAACATAVASSIKKLTGNDINVKFKEGSLNIKIDESLNISMTGPVSDIKHTKLEI